MIKCLKGLLSLGLLFSLALALPSSAFGAFCNHPGATKSVLTAATCYSEGEGLIDCPYCSQMTYVIPMTDHKMGSWTVVREATAQQEGLKQSTCSDCGMTETKTIPKLSAAKEPVTSHSSTDREVQDTSAPARSGWQDSKDGRRYYITNTKYAVGWYSPNNQSYYFDAEGYLVTGWYRDDETGIQYHFQPTGEMTTGWFNDQGSWYYFAEDGSMQTGWLELPAGSWYYLTPSGAMQTGWFQHSDKRWYYFTASGLMKTGWLQDTDGRWYYFEPSGVLKTGWLKDQDGSWYCFSQLDGHMLCSAYTPDGYWVGADGRWNPSIKLS